MKKAFILSLIGLVLLTMVALASGPAYKNYIPMVQRALDTPTPTLTAIPTEAPTPIPEPPNVQIVDLVYTGGEYVEIENQGSQAVQLQNWTLRDQANHVFVFPVYVIQPGQRCRVYTSGIEPGWCDFSYASGSPIWNNDGDCAYLNNQEALLQDTYCY